MIMVARQRRRRENAIEKKKGQAESSAGKEGGTCLTFAVSRIACTSLFPFRR